MMKRTPYCKTAKVTKQRAQFITKYHEDALAVLHAVDAEICENPGKGTETSQKGVFCRQLHVTAPRTQSLFLCEVAYTFTDRQVGWEGFNGLKVHKNSH
jgi:hypothetical protein